MLRKRIIFTLIYADGFFMQSRNFRLQRVGDINWLEKNYHFQKISFSLDEIIILNASRKEKDINKFSETVSRLSQGVFIPLAAGGGIRSMDDAKLLFQSGADKIVLNTPLFSDEPVVKDLISKYGAQSVVASIDYKSLDNIFVEDGAEEKDISVFDALDAVQKLGAGEIYLNSITKDGTGFGYDFESIKQAAIEVKVPLIIAGGAGNEKHLAEGLDIPAVSAVATANLFNFVGDGLVSSRMKLIERKHNLAKWF